MTKIPVLKRARLIMSLRKIFPKNSAPREFMKSWAKKMQHNYAQRLREKRKALKESKKNKKED